MSARCDPTSTTAPPLSASPAVCSSTTSTTGATCWQTVSGPERAAAWADAGAAATAGMRFSLHNDGTVTPPEPLRNISVAMTRRSRAGRVHGAEHGVSIDQALRAQTIDAAYQLFADTDIGSLEVGKYADLVVLSDDPREVAPEAVADLTVRATYLAGEQVYPVPALS